MEKVVDNYMKVPSGMQVSQEMLDEHGVKHPKHLALILKKSLCGLKQAGRLWSQLLHSKLVELGFSQCTTDMCLYVKKIDEAITIVRA